LTRKKGSSAEDKTALNAKIAEAMAKVAGVKPSATDGADIQKNELWATAADIATFNAAIDAAQAVAATAAATPSDISTQETALTGAISNFNPQAGLLNPSVIKATFNAPADESFTLGSAQTLSWKTNTTLTVTVTVVYDTYAWYVDGVLVPGNTGNSITLNARDFAAGRRSLSVRVTKGGVVYSKSLTFTVNNS